MSAHSITKQHILDAVEKIKSEKITLRDSTEYDVIIDGQSYPPKEIMRYANLLANGTKDWPYSGGEPTHKFLRKFGFDIVAKRDPSISGKRVEIGLTGNVWKLGCNWGEGAPIFYEMIKSKSIVICTDDRRYAEGDLVIMAVGFDVLAIAKVLNHPVSVLENSSLEEDFNKFEIDYEERVEYAKAEWYQLNSDEQFNYPQRTGRGRVHDPYKSIALRIWNDRSIDYWVFQCNPSDYDIETSIRNKLLRDWNITAHKDKIKKGDKIILWLTGQKAGVYALGRVTSDPAESSSSIDDHLWIIHPKTTLKAGIELTHNLLDTPLLQSALKDREDLKDLNVGLRGTNFLATRKQYNALLKLTEEKAYINTRKMDLSINTILYGPPGTGKTYQLKMLQEDYFTDRGIVKSSEELIREKISEYPFWKVLGAVLTQSKVSLSVTDIMNHPIVKSKINPASKAPRNTIWSILQSYADDDSTQVSNVYRGTTKLFHKTNDSEWSISEAKKSEVEDIIDKDLLDMVEHQAVQPIESTTSRTRFNFITFHQKYSYEDFIEGIKPLLKKDEIEGAIGGKELQFELKKGIFYNSCLESLKLLGYNSFLECYNDSADNRIKKFNISKNDPSKLFGLFIDEINRANISAVFGELITLLEDDKRIGADNEMWIELPYSNEKFCVPPNLYVIATMNTADRSIALLDIALRRRFEFKALYPEYIENEWWATLLEKMNLAIYNWKKSPDFFIGHAFFINRPEEEKVKIMNHKIIPLLNEYCQNNFDVVKRILSDAGVSIRTTGIKENFQIIAE